MVGLEFSSVSMESTGLSQICDNPVFLNNLSQSADPVSMLPRLLQVDHIHIYVENRTSSLKWYADVLGFAPIEELEFWASSPQEPLTIGSADGAIRLALFEEAIMPCRSTIALGATGVEFLAWHTHLQNKLVTDIAIFDHQVTWSLYFSDPDGNPFEITTHEYEIVAASIKKPKQ
jgi:catechol 2,3-dioxygenase-like lactoylglutathione lyase family enzyme